MGTISDPRAAPVHVWLGDASRRRNHGCAGTECRVAHSCGWKEIGDRSDMSAPVIIGAGVNGLSAAFYLAKAGLRPIVLERRTEVGGGAITGTIHPRFRCPTLSHEMLLDERVIRDMSLSAPAVEWLPTGVDVCAPAPDGPALVLH